VSKALDFFFAGSVNVVHIGRSIHLARSITLQLNPVSDWSKHNSAEAGTLEQVHWRTSENGGTKAETEDHHGNGVVNKHGSEISVLVVSQEFKD